MSREVATVATLHAEGHAGDREVRLRTHRFGRRERVYRAVKRLGTFWLLAAAAVFIPVLHLFLVPALFIAGIVGAVASLRHAEEYEEFESECPACGETCRFDPGRELRLPRRMRCPECDVALILKERAPGAGVAAAEG